MRKIISVFLIIFLVFTVGGCANSPKPESTVKEFIEAAKKFDFESMAAKVNSSKEKVTDLAKDENDQYQKYFLDYLKSNATKITYTIKDTKIDSNTAVVTVDFKYPNGGPLLKATIAEVFTKAMSLAFTGVELTEEETGQMFVAAMQKQQKELAESFTEKTLEIKCSKVDNQWYIDEPSDDLLDVIMSNFISVGKEFNNTSSNDTEEPKTLMEQAKKDNMTIIPKTVGDEITLATIKFKVNSIEEKQTISSSYGPPKTAKEGAKFVVINLEITNTTNKAFAFSPDLILVDNKGREFNAYSDAIGNIDNYIDYRDLSPSIKEKGNLVYELPSDATSYNLMIAKSSTKELYQIKLK